MHRSQVQQPEILPGSCASEHVNQAAAIRQEPRSLAIALHADFGQLRGGTIRMHGQGAQEREHLRAAVNNQVPVSEISQRISETSRPNSTFVDMMIGAFSAVAQGDGGIDAGCAARGNVCG
jgi:hypothetical protein